MNKRFHGRACSLCIMMEGGADILKSDVHWDGAASAYIPYLSTMCKQRHESISKISCCCTYYLDVASWEMSIYGSH